MTATPVHPSRPAESPLARCARLLPPRLRQRLRYARQAHGVRCQLRGVGAADLASLRQSMATVLSSRPPRVGFYPELPYKNYVLFKALSVLGWTVEELSPKSDVAVFWSDATDFTGDDRVLRERARVVNGRCRDIGKRRVDSTFAQVAGYGVQVDPLTHEGPMVCKADANAAHDGRVIEGPIVNVDPASVYQRVIDNELSPGAGVIEDLRLPVIGGQLPLAYIKHRPKATRFSNKNTEVAMGDVEALFSESEIETIRGFVAAFALDYGEIDVLRDRRDGRIYIIDVNKTPFGPPNGLPPKQAAEAVERIAAALRREWRAPTGA